MCYPTLDEKVTEGTLWKKFKRETENDKQAGPFEKKWTKILRKKLIFIQFTSIIGNMVGNRQDLNMRIYFIFLKFSYSFEFT